MLSEMAIPEFLDALGSSSPTPGGGGGAALTGAQGAALMAMVCSLTLGKKKYDEYQDLAREKLEELGYIKDRFLRLVDEDAREFQKVAAVYSMPRQTKEEIFARQKAMEEGLKACVKPPMEMMEYSYKALAIGSSLLGKTYAGAVSDIGVGALCLKAALQGAWLNVLINVNSMKDRDTAQKYMDYCKNILDMALPLSDEIYEKVKDCL